MARGSLTPIDQEYKQIISTNLRKLANLKNVKQIEIVKATGISTTTMSGYFNGTRLPTPENMTKLANFFHVSESDIDPRFGPATLEPTASFGKEQTVKLINKETGQEIIIPPVNISQDKKIRKEFSDFVKEMVIAAHSSNKENHKRIPANAISLEEFGLHRVPVVGTIACGEPIDAEQNVIDYMTIPGNIPNDAFALICEGSSMEPGLHDGDRVIIEPTPNVEDGEIAAVLVDGDTKATLKRIKHVGDTIELIPDNDDYDTIILDKDHPGRILGKKIQMIRYGSR